MKIKKNQNGIAHVTAILAAVVVVVVGAVGWNVWASNNNKTNNTTKNTKQSSRETPSNNKAYLEIPEFGVKITLSKKIQDAYYVILTKGQQSNASLSTKALDKISKNCSAAKDYFGGVYYFTDPNAPDPYAGESTNAEAFPDAIQIADKYYYLATNHQDSCLGFDYTEEKSKSLVEIRDAFDQAKLEKM